MTLLAKEGKVPSPRGEFNSFLPADVQQVLSVRALMSCLLPVVTAEASLCQGSGACCGTVRLLSLDSC